jgi:hypothetical protein
MKLTIANTATGTQSFGSTKDGKPGIFAHRAAASFARHAPPRAIVTR